MPQSTHRSILGLDHVIIGVDDLEGGRADYVRLGFTPAPRGDHAGRATSNYCLMFPDTYLEILGVVRPHLDSWGLAEGLASRGEGLQRLALGTPDADAARADLDAAGLNPQGPVDLSRPLEATGEIVRFRNLMIPPEGTAGLKLFLCGHKTPELMRNADLVRHPNGATAFVGITALVADLAPISDSLVRIFGRDAVRPHRHGISADTGRGWIDVATPESFALLHPGVTAPSFPLPNWYGLRVAVESVEESAAWLDGQNVPYERIEGGLRIAQQDARGVLLELLGPNASGG